jgi:signal transduction histidine kinase
MARPRGSRRNFGPLTPAAGEVWAGIAHGRIRIVVEDDGVGIPTPLPSGGFGIVGMRERAALACGALDVSRRPEGGTRLTLTLRIE